MKKNCASSWLFTKITDLYVYWFFHCDVSVYHNIVSDNSGLVGCDAVLFGKRYPTCCGIVVPSFSRAQQYNKGTYWTSAQLNMREIMTCKFLKHARSDKS
jgi:hypothetical protein